MDDHDDPEVAEAVGGLLRRRPVEATGPICYIGKEGNRLDDRISGVVTSTDEYRNEYIDQDGEWRRIVLPVLVAMDRKTLVERSGLHRQTIERYIYKAEMPRPAHRRHSHEALTQQAN